LAWRKLIHRGLDGWVVQGKPGRHTPRTLSATLLLPKPLTHLALDQLIGHGPRSMRSAVHLPLFRVTVIARLRLLPPQHVARLVRDQNDASAVEFTLDLGRLNRTAADKARSPGPTMDLDMPLTGGKRPSDNRART
jgi:hypothetical protein